MQIYKSASGRDSLCSCRRGAEVSGVQNQDCEGPTRTLRGPAAQGPRLLEVQGMYKKKKKPFQTHDPGSVEPQELNQELKVPSVCSHEFK